MKRLAWILGLWVSGCATAQTDVRFEGLEHPVSLSPHLPSAARQGSPTLLGGFRRELRAFSLVYGLVPLQKVVDPSEMIEEEIARLGGTGVTNLEVEVRHCLMNYAIPLNLLPFWPSCAVVELRGEVVGPPASAD